MSNEICKLKIKFKSPSQGLLIMLYFHNPFSFIFNIILLARATDTLLDIQIF